MESPVLPDFLIFKRMKLIAPNNIFSSLFYLAIDEKFKPEFLVKESSLIVKELLKDQETLAFIPSLDLINHKDLYVSSKFCIGFESYISNSYLYFASAVNEFEKVLLKGDVSANEVLLSKIIFKEIYNIQPEIELDVYEKFNDAKNYLVSGNLNWNNNRFGIGISFSEQITEFLELPYINYLLVSNSKTQLENFHEQNKDLLNNLSSNFEQMIKKINLGEEINDFLITNSDCLIYNFELYGNESYLELVKLLYFHQILNDMIDVKFV